MTAFVSLSKEIIFENCFIAVKSGLSVFNADSKKRQG